LERSPRAVELQDPAQRMRIEREVLMGMIRQRLAEQEVKRLKITVSDHDVDQVLSDIKRENGFSDAQLQAALQREGKTVKDLREKIRQELQRSRLVERVVKSKTVITETQVDARLQDPRPAPVQVQGARRLAMIFLPVPPGASSDRVKELDKLAQTIHRDLKAGADFGQLARRYSEGPGREEGGDIGYVSADELDPEIERALRGLAPGSASDVVRTPLGFYILKVGEAQQEKKSAGEPGLREKVRRELYQQEMAQKYEKWIKDLESKSYIQVNL
jgi:peptidyl-prolyl cis-trans isomerase SurA